MCYLLNKHLFGVCTPANDELGVAVGQTLPGDLHKELEIARTPLELLHLRERDSARQIRNEAVQYAYIFVAGQLTGS